MGKTVTRNSHIIVLNILAQCNRTRVNLVRIKIPGSPRRDEKLSVCKIVCTRQSAAQKTHLLWPAKICSTRVAAVIIIAYVCPFGPSTPRIQSSSLFVCAWPLFTLRVSPFRRILHFAQRPTWPADPTAGACSASTCA